MLVPMKTLKLLTSAFLLTAITLSVVLGQDKLSETFASDDTPFSFQYPAGWDIQGGGDGVYLTNSGDALVSSLTLMGGGEDPLQSGQILITIFAFPEAKSGINLQNFKKAEALGWVETLQPFSDAEAMLTHEPENLEIGGCNGLRFDAIVGDLEQLYLMMDIDADTLVFFTATTLKGEMPRHESTVLAIADTLKYAAPLRTGLIEDDGPVAEAGRRASSGSYSARPTSSRRKRSIHWAKLKSHPTTQSMSLITRWTISK